MLAFSRMAVDNPSIFPAMGYSFRRYRLILLHEKFFSKYYCHYTIVCAWSLHSATHEN